MSTLGSTLATWMLQKKLLAGTAAKSAPLITLGPAASAGLVGGVAACAAGTAATIYCLNKHGCKKPGDCCYFAGCQSIPQNLNAAGRARNNQGQQPSVYVNPLATAGAGAGGQLEIRPAPANRRNNVAASRIYANALPYAPQMPAGYGFLPRPAGMPTPNFGSLTGSRKGGKRRKSRKMGTHRKSRKMRR